MTTPITVETFINAPIEKIWKYWTSPEHITKWNNASEDWHTPRAVNDLKVGGKFSTRMEAKDGSVGFDFEGTYTAVEEFKKISYEMSDGRTVSIEFIPERSGYRVLENFDPENENPTEMQRQGWQAILDNFTKYVSA